ILVSRTASTCLGVRIADKFGITLVGFVRGDRMNIYTNGWRIDG
ncbi:MAG TPA: sulfurtransferase FdhD, partial [Sulfurovum sp.]|nr:sulfurtransferase FdhD [Sulfurovum sp.]